MTFYVSDLDGTLMNSQKEISEESKQILNSLMDRGLLFSIATARSIQSAAGILDGINFRVPIILMNGTAVYDTQKKIYTKLFSVDKETAKKVIGEFAKHGVQTFVYAREGEVIHPFYNKVLSQRDLALMCENDEEIIQSHKKVDNFDWVIENCDIVTIESIGEHDEMEELYGKATKIEGIHGVYYQDIYGSDTHHMELYSAGASKAIAIQYLAKEFGADRLIVFGDNVNDLPMFRISNECYATANAVDALKACATGVIECCDDDAVARFLQNDFGIE